jgi:DNA-binding LacI/PurR family transcriptional regulator
VVGIKDVAKRADVSIGTVSHVVNRPHVVAAATRSRGPAQRLGRTAAELLPAETADTATQHQAVVFTPELVVRESTRVRR